MPPFELLLDGPLTEAWREPRTPVATPPIAVRPMRADDARALGVFFDGLSQASRTARFHCGVRTLPEAWLERLTRLNDPNMHVLLAVAGRGAASTIVGEARYAFEPGLGAEFALVVADPFQGRGLGRRMLEQLVRAAAVARITTLYGDVQRDNVPMLALANAAGFRPRSSGDPLLVTVERRL